MEDHNNGILQFVRDPAMYVRLGVKAAQKENPLVALSHFKNALSADPKNVEARIGLAEILNRLGLYQESIVQLNMVYGYNPNPPSEILFALGCNYLSINRFSEAADYFDMYINEEPEGQYSLTAESYLDLIDDEDALCGSFEYDMYEGSGVYECISEAHYLFVSGNRDEAANHLNSCLADYPDSIRIRQEIILYELIDRKTTDVEQSLFELLKLDSKNVRTRTLMATLYLMRGDTEKAASILEGVKSFKDCNPADLRYMGSVLLDLWDLDAALPIFESVLSSDPNSDVLLHQYAVCCYFLGDPKKAASCYKHILEIDEDDLVAAYYLEQCSESLKKDSKKGWVDSYMLPVSKAIVYFKRFVLSLGEDGLIVKDNFDSDIEYYRILRWALLTQSPECQQLALQALSRCPGSRCEELLREFLLSYDQPDESKMYCINVMNALNIPEPRPAMLHGSLVLRDPKIVARPDDLPRSYAKMYDDLQRLRECGELPGYSPFVAEEMLNAYLNSLKGEYPQLRPKQRDAIVAACAIIPFGLVLHNGMEETICKLFDITMRQLGYAIDRIRAAVESDMEDETDDTDPHSEEDE